MQKDRVSGALRLTPNAHPTSLAQTIGVLAKNWRWGFVTFVIGSKIVSNSSMVALFC